MRSTTTPASARSSPSPTSTATACLTSSSPTRRASSSSPSSESDMEIKLPTKRLADEQVDLIQSLKPGERIRITQTVRVGAKSWPAVAVGMFRGVNYLATGITTDRVPEDDIIVPTLHFTKESGELASVSLD